MAQGVLSRWIIPIGADTKEFRKELQQLRIEARALGTISRGLNQASAMLVKTIVAPLVTIGTLGVKKFMQTTDAGAVSLKKELKGLTGAWDQMLARIGAAIYRHGELSKIIAGITKFMNEMDERKILRILEIGKWAAILAIVTKIGGVFTGWLQSAIRTREILGKLALGGAATTGGPAAGSIMAQTMGLSAAGGSGAAQLMGRDFRTARVKIEEATKWAMASGKTSLGKPDKLGFSPLKYGAGYISNNELTGPSAATKKMLNDYDAVTGAGAGAGITMAKSIGRSLLMFGKIFGSIAIAITAIFGIVQGIGMKGEKLIVGLDMITKTFEILGKVIGTLFDQVFALFYGLGATMQMLLGGNTEEFISKMKDIGGLIFVQTEASKKKMKEELSKYENKPSEYLKSEWQRLKGKPYTGEKPGKETFDFGHRFMGSAPALELNKIFQEMALENQTITLMNKQNDYLKQIADNTSSQPSWEQSHWSGGDLVPSVYKDAYALA